MNAITQHASRNTLPWPFICPATQQPLKLTAPDTLATVDGNRSYLRIDGIWRFLPPEREQALAQFMQEYASIRRREKRGSPTSDYYTSLPYLDTTGEHSADWQIRARSFESLVNSILPKLLNASHILDIGAGNGWLAGRLAKMGHHVAAIDLQTDAYDGLGAHVHYHPPITPLQAEFDHLPLADKSADLIIYNAAFHYSTNYPVTLTEALRVAKSKALIVIVDTPVYYHKESGLQMVAEREQHFLAQYGFRSNALPSENFLTYRHLQYLEKELSIKWGFYDPKFPLGWRLSRQIGRLRGGREPAQFPLIVGERKT